MPELFQIPVEATEPSFKKRIDLGARAYVFHFYFNERMSRWVMSVYDADEQPIVVGIVMVIDSSLTGRYSDPRLPEGEIILYDSSETHQECGYEDLGNRCLLIYEAP
ncbi:MAG TPA: hypothetical protein DF383_03595 [Deltaproteobacteria bacterium]|nr:hypothetical protein [Deltaproteobacteria bacterium]